LRIQLVKKKFADKVLEVLLIDMFAESAECCGILGGYCRVNAGQEQYIHMAYLSSKRV